MWSYRHPCPWLSRCCLLLAAGLFSPGLAAQEIPLRHQIYDQLEHALQATGTTAFTAFKPVLRENLAGRIPVDSVLYPARTGNFSRTLAGRKLFNENLFLLDHRDYRISLDPVLEFAAGSDGDNTWVNTRGLILEGRIGRQVTFTSSFYENQAVFPAYLDSAVRLSGVVPGQGNVKVFKESGFDYSHAEGYFSYTPSAFFNFRLGQGKHFIGDGYRSLLLSDNSFSYPFFRITTTFWKIQYSNLYTQFLDRSEPWSPTLGYRKKYATFHYLSIDLLKQLNVGLFEAVLWEAADSSGRRGYDLTYLNPVIFLRPVEFSLGSPDNVLLGINFRWRMAGRCDFYGQLMLDDFNLEHFRERNGWYGNKQGFQLGLAGRDVAGIRGLRLRAEYNEVRPYTYSHWSPLQAYGHYNQALAHPYGANFRELIVLTSYRYGFWEAGYQFIHALYGLDTAGHDYGKNIFLTNNRREHEFGNKVGQGLKTTLFFHEITLAYLINPRTGLRLEAGLVVRNENNDAAKRSDTFAWLSLKTSLTNRYYDF